VEEVVIVAVSLQSVRGSSWIYIVCD
jgi:hypothetical protein